MIDHSHVSGGKDTSTSIWLEGFQSEIDPQKDFVFSISMASWHQNPYISLRGQPLASAWGSCTSSRGRTIWRLSPPSPWGGPGAPLGWACAGVCAGPPGLCKSQEVAVSGALGLGHSFGLLLCTTVFMSLGGSVMCRSRCPAADRTEWSARTPLLCALPSPIV